MFSIRELRRRLQQGRTAKPETQPQAPKDEAEISPEASEISEEEAVRRDKWFWATMQTLMDITRG